MVFEVNDFLQTVEQMKSFWLKSRFNELRIEAHKDTNTIDFISIDEESGLETVASVSGYVSENKLLYARTVKGFYNAVKLLQDINVGRNNPLQLRLMPSKEDRRHFTLEVLLAHWDFVASTEKQ